MDLNKLPNFFIVGAPKCGTTALSEYLRGHPDVFMSSPKEPHYFASDMVDFRAISSASDYEALFSDVRDNHLAIGEASVWYLYSKDAIRNLRVYHKNIKKIKIIVMLRNPVEMVSSMHSQNFYNLQDNIRNFEEAWNLEKKRKSGLNVPRSTYHLPCLFYGEIAKYYSQLKFVFNYFDKENIHIILFDDFIKNTEYEYKKVLDFLNISVDIKIDFKKINQNKVYRFKVIQYLSLVIHKYRNDIKKFKKIINIDRLYISDILRKVNKVESTREEIPLLFKMRVIEHYREEVASLSELIGRDLSHWNTLS